MPKQKKETSSEKKQEPKKVKVQFISPISLAGDPKPCNIGETRELPKNQADELIKAGIAKAI